MANFESFPQDGPELTVVHTDMYPSNRLLDELGFTEPYIGTCAGTFADKEAYFWLGQFNDYDEAALIAAYVGKDIPLSLADYYYGLVRRSELEAAVDPIDFVLDAAMSHEPNDGKEFALYQTALKLKSVLLGAPQPN